jgi:molybdopterin converting factor small subunit
MSVKIDIPWFLERATDGLKTVEVSGRSVGDCLKELAALFPPVKDELFDREGKLSPFVDIHLAGRSIYSEGMDKPVKDGDELSIFLLVDGG